VPVLNDPMWWDLWWPWMLLWLATAAACPVLAVLAARPWLRRHVRRRHRPGHGAEFLVTDRTCIYLDNRTIMDQYQMNRYAGALRKEVEQRTRTARAARLGIRSVPFVSPGAAVENSRQVVTKYIEQAEAVSVIGVIVDGLERSAAIVHADLTAGTVRGDAALTKAHPGDLVRGRIRLSATESLFVLLTGDFARDDDLSSASRTVLVAPYGHSPALARVRVTCHTAELRTDLEPGPFPALCLGKVQSWKAADGVLEVRPLAIFS
jgi:hypothetical protein